LEERQIMDTYIPGQCNIGPQEVRKRYRIGFIGLALMIVFVIVAETNYIPQLWKLLLFAPTTYALSGFIQARHKFCFMFGLFGLFRITGRRTRVTDFQQLKRDRYKAFMLMGQIATGSAIITLLYYFIS
jgi:hypothetical protein